MKGFTFAVVMVILALVAGVWYGMDIGKHLTMSNVTNRLSKCAEGQNLEHRNTTGTATVEVIYKDGKTVGWHCEAKV